MDKTEVIAREREWSTRAGFAAILGAILALAGFVLLQSALGGDTNFEGLQEAHDKSATIWLSGAATAIGYALLLGPLLFLFRAAQARSPQVRNQFVGLVFLGPLLLALAGLVIAIGTQQAANTYLDGETKSTLTPVEAAKECREEREDMGAQDFAQEFEAPQGSDPQAACVAQKREEDLASNAIKDSSAVEIGQFLGLGGGLALVFALFYSCLWGMRTGLLTRFWGSLGMAVGVTALIGLSPLMMVWFVYLGFLLLGRVPGGRPPAWAAGEAIPWPTPGEKAAGELSSADESSAVEPPATEDLVSTEDQDPDKPAEEERSR